MSSGDRARDQTGDDASASAASRQPARLVVLLSGRGRNLEAIVKSIDDGHLDARIVLVVSNRGNAPGLRIAQQAGLACEAIEPATCESRADFDRALAERIAAESPDWVVLAGFMRVLDSAFVQRFAGRLINIHPSLLPRHKGLHTHHRVLEAGETHHGASVHFVTAELDDGPLILQGRIRVLPDDTPETLAARLMSQVEQRIYPAALAHLIAGRVRWQPGAPPVFEEHDAAPIQDLD